MTRGPSDRLKDILVACEAVAGYVGRRDVDEGLVFDAIRMRLVEIGEAVKDLESELLSKEPEIPWEDIARMRDLLAHRCFDTAHTIVFNTARSDLPGLAVAVRRILLTIDE